VKFQERRLTQRAQEAAQDAGNKKDADVKAFLDKASEFPLSA